MPIMAASALVSQWRRVHQHRNKSWTTETVSYLNYLDGVTQNQIFLTPYVEMIPIR